MNVKGPSVVLGEEDGQAPARRFGSCLAIVIILFSVACLFAVWYAISGDGINAFINSIRLQFNGVETSGTVTDLETFSDNAPNFPSISYKLIVTYEVNGQPYEIKSRSLYKGRERLGETVPVIYHPDDPGTAMIDTFMERWLMPFVDAAP